MNIIWPIPKAIHYRPESSSKVSCGLVGDLRYTGDPKAVDCFKCKRTKIWKELGDE